jgi:hypothetical protein
VINDLEVSNAATKCKLKKASEEECLNEYNKGFKGDQKDLKEFMGKSLSTQDMSKLIGICARIYKDY